MTTKRRIVRLIMICVCVGAAWWALTTFAVSQRTQMLRQHDRLLRALEKRDWSRIDASIGADYMDDWGHDAPTIRQLLRDALGGFLFLSIEAETKEVLLAPGKDAIPSAGMVKQTLHLEGSGVGISGMVVSRGNAITTPWSFHWHKTGRWPWNWQLVQIHNDTQP